MIAVFVVGDIKASLAGPPPVEFEGAPPRPQDASSNSGPSDLPSGKSAWYDSQHIGPWNPNQPVRVRLVLVC